METVKRKFKFEGNLVTEPSKRSQIVFYTLHTEAENCVQSVLHSAKWGRKVFTVRLHSVQNSGSAGSVNFPPLMRQPLREENLQLFTFIMGAHIKKNLRE